MKSLLQFFLLVAFALSLYAIPAVITHALANPVVSNGQFPAPAAPIPPELRNEGDPDLPVKGSPLPLVSLIGFVLLISGVVPAMRNRRITGTHS